jgi:hypothetical protein
MRDRKSLLEPVICFEAIVILTIELQHEDGVLRKAGTNERVS